MLSSLVDYRRETAWARAMRARGMRVGFIGLAADKLPHLFHSDADFVVKGEPESALYRLMAGEALAGVVPSPALEDLDALPFPDWQPLVTRPRALRVPFAGRPVGGSLPSSRAAAVPSSAPIVRIAFSRQIESRSVGNILDELSYLADTQGRSTLFRDPLFTQDRDRVVRCVTAF